MDYLFFVDNELYTIKILNREKGHYVGSYRIVTDDVHKLYESSQRKILLRLKHTFSLYRDDFNENESNKIIKDLEVLAGKLKIPAHFAEENISKLRNK